MPTFENEARELAQATREEARLLVVTTEETNAAAGEMLVAIKARMSRIDAIFDPIIKAAHEAHKTALGQKKEVAKFYVEADKHLRGQMSEYRGILEARRKLEAAALANRGEISLPAEAAKVDGVTFTKRWAFEVTDPDAVPRQFLSVDESKIRGVVNSLGADATIPGVRVWSYESPNVR